MLVYDVLRTVAPGTHSSYPRGTVTVATFDDLLSADRDAHNANNHCYCPGVVYSVEAFDESDPWRYPNSADVRENGFLENPADYDGRTCLDDWAQPDE